MKFILKRTKHKPGSAVQRFGDWRKGEPSVLIENRFWADFGKPKEVELIIQPKNTHKTPFCGT